MITSPDGRIEYVNDAFERLTGYLRADVIGKNPRILSSGQQPRAFYAAMWECVSRGETFSADMVNRRKDGSIYHQHTTISAVQDASGRIVNYVAAGREIGHEIVLEARLEQALRHTQTILEASSVGIISYRATGEATSANPAAAAIVGGTVDQLVNQNFHHIESWKASGLYDAAITALATGQEQRLEVSLATSFGRKVCVNARCVPYQFENESYLMLMMADITERKSLEARFLQAQKMEAIGRLAGGIAHDFNNILSVIMSFSGFVRDALPDDDERRTDLDEVLKAADRATRLTKQLLIFSRQQPAEKRPTDLNQSVAEICKFLARAVGEDVRLSVTPAATPVVVAIDPVQFDQVMLNLAVNARDAMPNGGRLELEVRRIGDARARLTVSDTGIGMDEATKQRIFEPFFTTKERTKGTGLGLATCFGIVTDAGGTIEVESTPGKGTTFSIDLPLCEGMPNTDHFQIDPRLQGHGEIVLVVEDEAAVRRATVRVLESAGYDVYAASDADKAMSKIRELGSDLRIVVTDVVLPGATGHDIARYLRDIAPHVPVLLTSGYLDESTRRAHSDALPILWKPVKPHELVAAVARELARDRARAAHGSD